MTHHDKYNKYKHKYLLLKNNNYGQFGGGKINYIIIHNIKGDAPEYISELKKN